MSVEEKSRNKSINRFNLLILGLKKGVVSSDGEINGKAIAEMSYEEINEWLEKLIKEE